MTRTTAQRTHSVRGFTLVEVLVALTIFALLSILGYRTLSSLLDTRERMQAQSNLLRDQSLLFTRMEGDFNALLARPIVNGDNQTEATLRIATAQLADEASLRMTRAGYAAAEGVAAAPQRVGYRLREGNLELLIWDGLDIAPRAAPNAYIALRGVREFRLRVLDTRGQWHSTWPISAGGTITSDAPTMVALPRAIEVTIAVDGAAPITRLFSVREVSGV
ncbi:MAG: type II secretion system minor pseudopilin GspJ [Burkholderiales bacterium]